MMFAYNSLLSIFLILTQTRAIVKPLMTLRPNRYSNLQFGPLANHTHF
jgi:hypothetical protein